MEKKAINNLPKAIEAWTVALGKNRVLADPAALTPYQNNVSGLYREIPAVLCPESAFIVQEIVRIANKYGTPLYPVSCGKNLGLGSRLPVRNGTCIVDLSRMKQIREVNVRQSYAVVEPGVSQGQLYDHLRQKNFPLLLNVTGSGREASVIGNALERGIGYFSTRAGSLSGLEVVLGNGEILRTGFGHYPGCKTVYSYPYGIGPDLNGLFCQSNYGIVTSAGVELKPKPEAHSAILASLQDEDKLADFVEALAELRRGGLIEAVVHIGNRHRTEITLGPLIFKVLRKTTPHHLCRRETLDILEAEKFGVWSALIGLSGARGQVAIAQREIRARLRSCSRVVLLNDKRYAFARRLMGLLDFIPFFSRKKVILEAVEPLYGLGKGIPSDAALGSLYWPIGEMSSDGKFDADQDFCGMLYCLPMMPLSGKIAEQTMKETDKICARHGFLHNTTLNIIDHKTLEGVITLAFDRRNADQVSGAHRCLDDILGYYICEGFHPYRVGIQSMSQLVDPNNAFWQSVRALKKVFDPNHIIAPGRYNLV